MITKCPICAGVRLECVLDRDHMPVFQNVLYRTEHAARLAAQGRVALTGCCACGFIFNAAFDSQRIEYGLDYENDQSHSPVFHSHMIDMADRVLAAVPAGGGTVVDVGCGQGTFLSCLAQRASSNVRLRGFDPSYRGVPIPGAIISTRLLGPDAMTESPEVAVARHVIEHIADPVAFLSTIRQTMRTSHSARLFLETPCFDWIVKNSVVHDVFYEHVNYFTKDTLSLALVKAGFHVSGIEHVFNGQYLWANATAGDNTTGAERDATAALADARKYSASVTQQIADWRGRVSGSAKMAIWGAGAKGVTFSGLVDPGRAQIDCLIDVNPRKQGGFVPVTGHPIVSPAEAEARGVRSIVVMNPNYLGEIQAQIRALNWNALIVEPAAGAV